MDRDILKNQLELQRIIFRAIEKELTPQDRDLFEHSISDMELYLSDI